MAMMDPQFTHGKLLEAASLLRLPVNVLVESLGLAPDLFTSTTLRPPTRLADSTIGAVPWWPVDGRHWPYPDQDQITSSEGSPPSFEVSTDLAQATAVISGPLLTGLGTRSGLNIIETYQEAEKDPNSQWMQAPSWIHQRKPSSHHRSPSLLGLSVSPKLTSIGLAPSDTAVRRTKTPRLTASHGTTPSSSRPSPVAPSPAVSSPASHHSVSVGSSAHVKPVSEFNRSGRDGLLGSPTGSSSAGTLEANYKQSRPGLTHQGLSGPCSKVWKLPPRIRRRKKIKIESDEKVPSKARRDSREVSREGPKRRGAYTDETKKRNTAMTRILKSCIRCRMNRGRCNPDPEDPYGPCLTCKRITGPTLCKMPCFRYIITDASLYREQRAPYQVYSRRWQSMDIINIPAGDWASPEIRTVVVSPNHVQAPFTFRVREFIPADGDLLEEQWMTPTGKQTVPLPRFAVAEMNETAQDMKEYIETNVWKFIAVTAGDLDQLLWDTYTMAFRHIGSARTPEERSLLTNVFRLWVTCRLISNPVHICGEDKLGGYAIYSHDSLHNGKVPMPAIMTAQFECINYTTFLRPWSKAVLKQLNELVLAKKREYWLTIYYSMFVLLHSCAMMTRRDEETARQYDMNTQYANPESIRAHHSGARTMLAHFHFINKGVIPFSLPHNVAGRQELSKAASLTDEEVDFVWRTARLVNEPERAARMREVRECGVVGDDLYWVSMLFDREWIPHAND